MDTVIQYSSKNEQCCRGWKTLLFKSDWFEGWESILLKGEEKENEWKW
jgi:hypothetical protein